MSEPIDTPEQDCSICLIDAVDANFHMHSLSEINTQLDRAVLAELATPLANMMAGDSEYISIEYFRRRIAELKGKQQ